ncbi:hypothetical protein [Helicobacter sp. 11S02629-2]|uniref:hypothetical protein n=1 Tax=Helicobacter sp. 11S02629-2 TaxID=1476195 RepID=UPI000BA57596|nr:hypothetical protein [Helicobacter sp. 11S02629-2]PAF45488.1 hypothetical protein BKH40_03230 [Helicobacter sp. 11S02629-2]
MIKNILLSTALVLGSLASSALAQEASSYDINGPKVIVGIGSGVNINGASNSQSTTPKVSPNANLKLGTGIFSTNNTSTMGLAASANASASSQTLKTSKPSYSANLDFMQAFKVGSGKVKLGYIVGGGAALEDGR